MEATALSLADFRGVHNSILRGLVSRTRSNVTGELVINCGVAVRCIMTRTRELSLTSRIFVGVGIETRTMS